MAHTFRSTFETMVFQNTGTENTGTENTGDGVFAWMQDIHPSRVEEEDGVYDSTIPEDIRTGENNGNTFKVCKYGAITKPFREGVHEDLQ